MLPSMDNHHLFELINTTSAAGSLRLLVALLLTKWMLCAVLIGYLVLWVRGSEASRLVLLQVALAALIAVPMAELVRFIWPTPRPATLGVGTQYFAASRRAGMPDGQVTILWALALRALGTRDLAVWSFPLLAAGLVLGFCCVYVGINFPFDIFAAFPVAAISALAAWTLRSRWHPVARKLQGLYDRSMVAFRRHFFPPSS